jgi:hypothetical protein
VLRIEGPDARSIEEIETAALPSNWTEDIASHKISETAGFLKDAPIYRRFLAYWSARHGTYS